MPAFKLVISADGLPEIEGERLQATVENITQERIDEFFGLPDADEFVIDYVGNYGDKLSVVRAWTLGESTGPEAGAVLVQLPFPNLPMPTGGGVLVSLA